MENNNNNAIYPKHNRKVIKAIYISGTNYKN